MEKKRDAVGLKTKNICYLPTPLLAILTIGIIFFGFTSVHAIPSLDKSKYHMWDEVESYLMAIADDQELSDFVELLEIGTSREDKPLYVLRISKEGISGKDPDTKPAAFIMGAHHAREHVSKEAVLALIDKIINGYGKPGNAGQAITYLVDAGTFYLMPWVNPDGGMHEFLYNPEQRKTNYIVDEPQIGAADYDDAGDGLEDEDSPNIDTGDVGETSILGSTVAFGDNGIISRHLQLWYEDGNYFSPVLDQRVARVQPGGSAYTFNYEGNDPDEDGEFYPYSGEDFVGGTDPNRNYGGPTWGDCDNNEGCSFLTGAQTYCGPGPFSEPETAAVANFLQSHPNIVTAESLHSGVNEIYPPWWIYPDDSTTMDMSYQDSVAQYISQQTGYEVLYGGQYSVDGDTTGYTYIGSGQDLGLEFWPGGILSFTTEIYGMGSDSGSAEAIRDWFPNHWQQFDTSYPQGIFITWSDFPWCTTCDPDIVYDAESAPLPWYNYTQYMEYFIFNSNGRCGGGNAPDIFHCDYWGIGGSPDYYADLDIFAYFNPPAVNRCYEDWNCAGDELVRTVDRQLKHLLYRLYIAPFIRVNAAETTSDDATLDIAIENTGFLRSSVMTTQEDGGDPFGDRSYSQGLIEVQISSPAGFTVNSENPVNIGWLGGGHANDSEPRVKFAGFTVDGLSIGDTFTVSANSDKTGLVTADMKVVAGKNGSYEFKIVSTNDVKRVSQADAYFRGIGPEFVQGKKALSRSTSQIMHDMNRAEEKRKKWKRMEGPFDVISGHVKGITVKKYH
jgi:Zinc carboxypeptidase